MNNLWSGWQQINSDMLNFWNKSFSSFQPKPAETETETPNLLSKLTEEILNQQQTAQDIYKKFFDLYGEWSKTYNIENLSKVLPKELNNITQEMNKVFKESLNFNNIPNLFSLENSMNTISGLSKQWYDNMQNFTKLIPNSSAKDTFERLTKSFNIYNNLYSFWSDLVAAIPNKDDSTAWNQFISTAVENYKQVAENFTQSFLPEDLKTFIINPLENLPVYQQTMANFFGPWLQDSNDMRKNFMLALKGDSSAYIDFLNNWNTLYQDSYSKALNMPMIGSNRVIMEKCLKNLDSFIKYCVHVNEFLATIVNISVTNMENLMKSLSDLLKEDKAPKSFMEFFKLWSSTNEKAFENLFATESFSKLMNDTVNAGYEFKIGLDELIQEQLAVLPIPNRKEINSVEKTVYELRKQVKKQNKEINALKEKIETLKGGAIG